jgi:hypothetical protein
MSENRSAEFRPGDALSSRVPAPAADRARTRRRLTFTAGILVFLIGVTLTIVTPDNLALSLSALGIGVILVALPGTRDTSTQREIATQQRAAHDETDTDRANIDQTDQER